MQSDHCVLYLYRSVPRPYRLDTIAHLKYKTAMEHGSDLLIRTKAVSIKIIFLMTIIEKN